MSESDKIKKCPEYCPFLVANGSFCELFRKNLQQLSGNSLKSEECLNPEQRMTTYKDLGLSLDNRINMWQKAVIKHNEIELGKKREEEAIRKKFAEFLSDKYGSRPPLEGNQFLNNLVINLFMVLDATERKIMYTILNSNLGEKIIQAIDRTPKDDSLLRNFRRELDNIVVEYQQSHQNLVKNNENQYN